MVLRLTFTDGSSALTSAEVMKGCFLIALTIAKSSLGVVHLGRPERGRLTIPPVSLNSFSVLQTDALLQPTLCAIAEYDRSSLASATITDRFFGVNSATLPMLLTNISTKLTKTTVIICLVSERNHRIFKL
jgi:hypothetical protein